MNLDRDASRHAWQHSEGVVASVINIHNQQYMDESQNWGSAIIIVTLHHQLTSEGFLSVSDAQAKTGGKQSKANTQVEYMP